MHTTKAVNRLESVKDMQVKTSLPEKSLTNILSSTQKVMFNGTLVALPTSVFSRYTFLHEYGSSTLLKIMLRRLKRGVNALKLNSIYKSFTLLCYEHYRILAALKRLIICIIGYDSNLAKKFRSVKNSEYLGSKSEAVMQTHTRKLRSFVQKYRRINTMDLFARRAAHIEFIKTGYSKNTNIVKVLWHAEQHYKGSMNYHALTIYMQNIQR